MHCSNIYQQVVPKFGGSKWKTWSPKVEVKDLGMSQNARNMRGHKFLAKAGRKHLQGCVLRKPVGSPRNTQNLWNQGCPFRCKKLRFSSHPRKTVSNLRALLEHLVLTLTRTNMVGNLGDIMANWCLALLVHATY